MGKAENGEALFRVAAAGHSVTESDGQNGTINFDSRWGEFGKIHQSGTKQGYGAVNFIALAGYPLVEVVIEDSSGFLHPMNELCIRAGIWANDAVFSVAPSFIVDVEKDRFTIGDTRAFLNITGNQLMAGVDCGNNPKFHYVVWAYGVFA